jgi:hypothetical protein
MKNSKIPKMKDLLFFVGRWQTNGVIISDAVVTKTKINGNDTYEWVAGGHFLLHRVDVMIGDERTEVVEIIGLEENEPDHSFAMRSFDNQGKFTTMKGYLEEPNLFKIEGEGVRSKLVVNENHTIMNVFWEQSSDGVRWIPWMELKLTKEIAL